MNNDLFRLLGENAGLQREGNSKVITNEMQKSRSELTDYVGFDRIMTPDKKNKLSVEYQPMEEALQAMIADKNVEIEKREDQIIFRPLETKPSKAILFYPGCKIDQRAYAPLCKMLAKEGYLVVVGKLDMRSIIGEPAKKIFGEHKEIKDWFVAGHSLGGCVATEIAYFNQDKVRGAIMFASFPVPYFRRTNIKFLDIRATNDKILNDKVADVAYKMNVAPGSIERVNIVGGNHGNFGHYDQQKSDGNAEIHRDEQQKIVFEKMLEFIKKN